MNKMILYLGSILLLMPLFACDAPQIGEENNIQEDDTYIPPNIINQEEKEDTSIVLSEGKARTYVLKTSNSLENIMVWWIGLEQEYGDSLLDFIDRGNFSITIWESQSSQNLGQTAKDFMVKYIAGMNKLSKNIKLRKYEKNITETNKLSSDMLLLRFNDNEGIEYPNTLKVTDSLFNSLVYVSK